MAPARPSSTSPSKVGEPAFQVGLGLANGECSKIDAHMRAPKSGGSIQKGIDQPIADDQSIDAEALEQPAKLPFCCLPVVEAWAVTK